jgi:glycosyltransferase involved in cell wall biosynthesis
MSMNNTIVFNALQASRSGAGISRYTLELGRALLALRDDVSIVVQRSMADRFECDPDRLVVYDDLDRSWRRILAEQLSLPRRIKGARLVHYPDCMVPLLSSLPSLLTLHDLTFYRYPETFTWRQVLWKRFISSRSVRRARRVICDSENTARDAKHFLNVPEMKLSVVYPGLTHSPAESERPASIPEGTPFILAVGTLEPRKNIARLIKALAMLRQRGHDCKLVLTGKSGWRTGPIFDTLKSSGMEEHVLCSGYCSERELKWLYENALCLAYVSLYEGFGIPPLEAMANSLPVVASRVSSIPEACGDAAEYVDPMSVEDIAAGVDRVLVAQELRRTLVAKGRLQMMRFDYASAARAVSAIYDEVLSGG